MESLKASIPIDNSTGGFTMLEITVVMGLFAMIGVLALLAGMDSYRGYAFRSERDLFVAALQKARSQAVNNICLGTGCTDGKSHGLAVVGGNYVIFQGASYATRNTPVDSVIDGSSAIVKAGLSEIVFTQLSGDVVGAGDFILTDDVGHSSTISINPVGQIIWTH